MGTKTKQTILILFLLMCGVAIIVGVRLFHLHHYEKKVEEKVEDDLQPYEEKKTYTIGKIKVDTKKNEIYFSGKIYKNRGWVQHLIYLDGYKWLKENSAIVCEAKLQDLQKAIALLDWQLWDDLWYREKQKRLKIKKVNVYLKWDKEKFPATQFIKTNEPIRIEHLMFLGSPYFDPIALESSPGVDCSICPIFPLEKKALLATFVRDSGQSGYKLNSSLIPHKGTIIEIIIKII